MIPSLIYVVIFVGGLITGVVLTYHLLKERARGWLEEWKVEQEDKIRKDVVERSRSALKGRVGEQLAPLLPFFEYEPSDARFIGSPVDYVIFEGHSEESPEGVVFAEVKTGKTARLTPREKKFKEVIEDGRVKWRTIHIEGLEE